MSETIAQKATTPVGRETATGRIVARPRWPEIPPTSPERSGWFWWTPEGRLLMHPSNYRSLDDPAIGWQREDD
jgi:hypothetical protein